MQRICMTYDIYYDNTSFEACENDDDEVIIGNYIKKLNLSQHKGKTFNDTIEDGFSFGDTETIETVSDGDEDSEPPADPKLVMKWGNGFSSSDYTELEAHYKMLKKNKRNRPRLKTLIVFCVIIALITFAIVVGVKLYNKNNGNGTTANITYNV